MISVVIPAYNEAKVIERCLTRMLEGAEPDELEIVVVCNGCTDETARRARSVHDPRVKVIETPIGSKVHALNLGDQAVSSFPRFYVDADVELRISAIRDVAKLLEDDPSIVVASPTAVVNCVGRHWVVQSFYRVWTQMPYFKDNMIGSGVYAFSRKGRSRFQEFPHILGDDEFARRMAKPHERQASRNSTFTIHPPRNVQGLIKILTRARVALYELDARFPQMEANKASGTKQTLRAIRSEPRLWPDAPIYAGITLAAILGARRQRRTTTLKTWSRDDTSRQ